MIQGHIHRQYDRFIDPKTYGQRSNVEYSSYGMPFGQFEESAYSDMIKRNLFEPNKKNYSSNSSQDTNDSLNMAGLDSKYMVKPTQASSSAGLSLPAKQTQISPVKILNVPNVKDDFYLNLLDWHKDGPVGIALDNEVFVYTPTDIVQLAKTPIDTYVSCIKFNDYILSVGLSNGDIQIYDLERNCMVRRINSHSMRVSSLAFSSQDAMLISGSKDTKICYDDLRVQNSLCKTFQAHNGQVCTLKVKPDQMNFFASGGNDNRAKIWDIRCDHSLATLKGHKGAVKGISWCPWKSNTLATGGGKNDKSIKIWGQNQQLISSTQTQGQISGLQWNSKHRSLISSHGSHNNEVNIWTCNFGNQHKNNTQNILKKTQSSRYYKGRVLSMIQSKQQDMLCTVSADDTLKFFELFSQSCSNGINSLSGDVCERQLTQSSSYRIM